MNWSELSDAEIAEYLAYSALGDVRNISNSVLNILHTADTILFAEKKGNTITVTCEKQKNAEEFKPIKVTLLPAHDSCIAAPCNRGTHAASVCKSHLRSTLETLAESGEKGLGWTEWLKATGKPEGTFGKHLSQLSEDDHIKVEDGIYRVTEKGRAALL